MWSLEDDLKHQKLEHYKRKMSAQEREDFEAMQFRRMDFEDRRRHNEMYGLIGAIRLLVLLGLLAHVPLIIMIQLKHGTNLEWPRLIMNYPKSFIYPGVLIGIGLFFVLVAGIHYSYTGRNAFQRVVPLSTYMLFLMWLGAVLAVRFTYADEDEQWCMQAFAPLYFAPLPIFLLVVILYCAFGRNVDDEELEEEEEEEAAADRVVAKWKRHDDGANVEAGVTDSSGDPEKMMLVGGGQSKSRNGKGGKRGNGKEGGKVKKKGDRKRHRDDLSEHSKRKWLFIGVFITAVWIAGIVVVLARTDDISNEERMQISFWFVYALPIVGAIFSAVYLFST